MMSRTAQFYRSVLALPAPLMRKWPNMAWDVGTVLGVLALAMVLGAAVTDETAVRERTAIRTARAYLADRTPELRHQMRSARVLVTPDAPGLTIEVGTGGAEASAPLVLHCVDIVGGRAVAARPCPAAIPETTGTNVGGAAITAEPAANHGALNASASAQP